MSARRPAPAALQPEAFAFDEGSRAAAERILARYPADRRASAVMPLLDLAQRQHGGWLPTAAIAHVADMIDMPYIRAFEVASFYEMYNLAPVGRHLVRICTTTPCALRGAGDVVAACAAHLGVAVGGTTADEEFTLREVECLGACVNAPVVWIGDDYYEDVSPERATELLDALRAGQTCAPGSQTGRQGAAPAGGPTTLRANRD